MSRSRRKAIQISCLTLSRSILAAKKAFWPESGWILAVSGCKFLYGSVIHFGYSELGLNEISNKMVRMVGL